MNKIIWPSAFATSLRTVFKRSSNSPRYLAPAIKDPMSREMMVLLAKLLGTSPFAIRCANPSTMAVFPTPGSPIRTGLFLVFRDKIRITSKISSSRPITGSGFSLCARFTKSVPYFSSALYPLSCSLDVTFSPPRNSSIFSNAFLAVTPCCFKKLANSLLFKSNNAKNTVSTAMNSSCSFWRRCSA